MAVRFRILGILIVACGLAVCYGAFELWPAGASAGGHAEHAVVGILRMAGAAIAAVVGVLNVAAGLAVLVLKPARE